MAIRDTSNGLGETLLVEDFSQTITGGASSGGTTGGISTGGTVVVDQPFETAPFVPPIVLVPTDPSSPAPQAPPEGGDAALDPTIGRSDIPGDRVVEFDRPAISPSTMASSPLGTGPEIMIGIGILVLVGVVALAALFGRRRR